MEQDINERHKEKAALRQASYARKKASATREKGLILVHTGPGKGKTTAALGLAFRALGQGMKVGMVQFITGAIPTGEAVEEVLEELRTKREMLHVVITGRNAREELMELADLVTEMKPIKHPYKAGIKAQRGVEF
jgi:ATP:corrinoid adenosyltransferase